MKHVGLVWSSPPFIRRFQKKHKTVHRRPGKRPFTALHVRALQDQPWPSSGSVSSAADPTHGCALKKGDLRLPSRTGGFLNYYSTPTWRFLRFVGRGSMRVLFNHFGFSCGCWVVKNRGQMPGVQEQKINVSMNNQTVRTNPMDRPLLMKQPRRGIPSDDVPPDAAAVRIRLPIYDTIDAGRGF